MNKEDLIFVIICSILGILLIVLFLHLGKEDKENYNKCIEEHSKTYCNKTIYGIY